MLEENYDNVFGGIAGGGTGGDPRGPAPGAAGVGKPVAQRGPGDAGRRWCDRACAR